MIGVKAYECDSQLVDFLGLGSQLVPTSRAWSHLRLSPLLPNQSVRFPTSRIISQLVVRSVWGGTFFLPGPSQGSDLHKDVSLPFRNLVWPGPFFANTNCTNTNETEPHFPKQIAESMVQQFAAARSIVVKSHHFNPGCWQGTFIFRQCICRLPSKPSRKHQIKSHPKASTSGLAPTASAALGSQVVQSFTNTIHHCCETCK